MVNISLVKAQSNANHQFVQVVNTQPELFLAMQSVENALMEAHGSVFTSSHINQIILAFLNAGADDGF